MKKQHVVSVGYYCNLAFDNIKDAASAYEILSKGLSVEFTYIHNSQQVAVMGGNAEVPVLKSYDAFTKDELDALKEKEEF